MRTCLWHCTFRYVPLCVPVTCVRSSLFKFLPWQMAEPMQEILSPSAVIGLRHRWSLTFHDPRKTLSSTVRCGLAQPHLQNGHVRTPGASHYWRAFGGHGRTVPGMGQGWQWPHRHGQRVSSRSAGWAKSASGCFQTQTFVYINLYLHILCTESISKISLCWFNHLDILG